MGSYTVTQLSQALARSGVGPLNPRPSISADGSRCVYAHWPDSSGLMPVIWLYEPGADDDLRRLTVDARGEERVLVSYHPQISWDGHKVVFDCRGYYTDEDETGIYVYDIDSRRIRRVVDDHIPRLPGGVERDGEPGLTKSIATQPSISHDGRWISYVLRDYEYSPSTAHRWRRWRDRLLLADLSGERVRGGTILHIDLRNTFGHGIHSAKISADGKGIVFYAGGVIDDLQVQNLRMPPYREITHGEHVGPTCDVHCYVVHIERPPDYTLQVVNTPESQNDPLVVAHPQSRTVQSFVASTILDYPPSISARCERVALTAGLVMGATNTGVYVHDLLGAAARTHHLVSFGTRPGDGPGPQTLTTGVVPAISPDGRWLAHYQRDVTFPEGYSDSDEYEEGQTYCPWTERDEVVVRQLPDGDLSQLIEGGVGAAPATPTRTMGVDLSRAASHVAFASTADRESKNADQSHEVYFGERLPD